MENLTLAQKQAIKAKAAAYLEKSIYTLSVLLGLDPEQAVTATSIDDLLANETSPSAQRVQIINSLFNQIKTLKTLS